VFLDGASATLRDNTYTGNDVDVWQQHCDETVGPVIECEAPSIESCPDPARLNTELRWLFNFLDPETTE